MPSCDLRGSSSSLTFSSSVAICCLLQHVLAALHTSTVFDHASRSPLMLVWLSRRCWVCSLCLPPVWRKHFLHMHREELKELVRTRSHPTSTPAVPWIRSSTSSSVISSWMKDQVSSSALLFSSLQHLSCKSFIFSCGRQFIFGFLCLTESHNLIASVLLQQSHALTSLFSDFMN